MQLFFWDDLNRVSQRVADPASRNEGVVIEGEGAGLGGYPPCSTGDPGRALEASGR